MRKTRIMLPLILAGLCLLASLTVVSARADSAILSGSCGPNLTWTLSSVNGKQTLTISGTGPMTSPIDMTVPGTHDSYVVEALVINPGVTALCDRAISSGSFTSVNIPDSVETLGKYVFDSGELQTINIGSGVTSIDADSFENLCFLRRINVSSNNPSYKSVNGVLFSKDGTKLIKWPTKKAGSPYSVPYGVTEICENAFYYIIDGDVGIVDTDISIPNSVTKIAQNAFFGPTFGTLDLGTGLQEVGQGTLKAFLTINFAGSERQFASIPGISAAVSPNAYIRYGIPNVASGTCGNNVFWSLESTGTLWIHGSGPMEDYTADGKAPWYDERSSILSVIIDPGVTAIGDYSFAFCSELAGVTIPSGVTEIGDFAFDACESLAEIQIPAGVADIGEYAFYMSGLESLELPGSVTNVSERAFSYCESLGSIKLSSGVSVIGDHAFYGCSNLESLELPSSLTSIGQSAFSAGSLKDVYYYGSAEEWQSIAGNDSIKHYELDFHWMRGLSGACGNNLSWMLDSDGVMTISGTGDMISFVSEDDAPWDVCRHSIKQIIIQSGITGIGDNAFAFTAVNSVEIPTGVTSIGRRAFAGSPLTEAVIPSGVTSIGNDAFRNCSLMASVDIPAGVTSIGAGAFESCCTLSGVELPDSVTSIEDFSFANCRSLKSVTIPENVTSIKSYAFSNCSSLENVEIPFAVIGIGDCAFNGCNSLVDVYYGCTESMWDQITVGSGNDDLLNAEKHYTDTILITSQPESVTAPLGSEIRFHVEAEGEELTYQWQVKLASASDFGNSGAASAKTDTLILNTASGHQNMLVRCVVRDKYGDRKTTSAASYSTPEVTITSQPESVHAPLGSEIRFHVEAEGEELTYQWQVKLASKSSFSNSGAPGAKTDTLVLNTVNGHQNMLVRCVVKDMFGRTKTTSAVSYTVPEITIASQPESVHAPLGSEIRFHVEAEGEELTYQWQVKLASKTAFSNSGAPSAKTDTLILNTVNGHQNMQVRCVVKDKYGNTRTTPATVYTAPEITIASQPESVHAPLGSEIRFHVEAEGEELTYQWQVKLASKTSFSNSGAPGAKTDTLILNTVNGHQNMLVRCVVKDKYGNTKTTSAVSYTAPEITITTQPESVYAPLGSEIRFHVEAEGEELTYQWQVMLASRSSFSNSGSPSAKTDTLVLNTVNGHQNMLVRCVVKDKHGSTKTSSVVSYTAPEVTIASQPENVTAPLGSEIRFHVEAEGEELTYQWQVKLASKTSFSNSGSPSAKTDTLILNTVNGHQNMLVRCVVKDKYGNTKTTSAAAYTVPIPLAIISQPVSCASPVGSEVRFHVEASGDGLTYRWQVKTASALAFEDAEGTGAGTDTYVFTSEQLHNAMQVRCVVSDRYGRTATSETATYIIADQAPSLEIVLQPESVTAPTGSQISFHVEAEGEDLTYQWQVKLAAGVGFGNSSAAGAKTDTFTITPTNVHNNMQVRCIVSDPYGNVEISETATYRSAVPIVITGQPESFIGPIGSAASFHVEAEGEGLTYRWQVKLARASDFGNSGAASARTDTFTVNTTSGYNNMLVRCIVTDSSGNTETTNVVSYSTESPAFPLTITSQPESFLGPIGSAISFHVEAEGEDLTYQWQVKLATAVSFGNSGAASAKTDTFTITPGSTHRNMEVRCVVKDKSGMTVTSEVVRYSATD